MEIWLPTPSAQHILRHGKCPLRVHVTLCLHNYAYFLGKLNGKCPLRIHVSLCLHNDAHFLGKVCKGPLFHILRHTKYMVLASYFYRTFGT